MEKTVQFENHFVKIWKTQLQPKQSLSTNQSTSCMVLCPEKGKLKQVNPSQSKPIEKQGFLIEPSSQNQHLNTSTSPLDIMIVEFKKTEDPMLSSKAT